jgi:hypothetical protein
LRNGATRRGDASLVTLPSDRRRRNALQAPGSSPCFNPRMNNPQPWWLTWPVAEVAAAILPLFCHSESQRDKNARACIVNWCKTGSCQSTVRGLNTDPFKDPDHRAINEAMQVLE